MKIGIISINLYPKKLNPACPLHSYSFQQFLKENGYDSVIINYKPIYYDNFDMEHPSLYYEKKINRGTAKPEDLKRYQRFYRLFTNEFHGREVRYQKFREFTDKYLVTTDTCYDSDLLEVMDPGFDIYMCVTDVIWKRYSTYGFDRGFFLGSSCMKNKWKIAYSASRNTSVDWTQEDMDLFFHYLSDMDYISVREKSLKSFIEKNSSCKASWVLDPVLLHNQDFWEKILVRPKESHYILLYYVMEKATDTIDEAVKYAKQNHLKIIEISEDPESRIEDSKVDSSFHYVVGIEEWLGYIAYADIVFTNSFHATCFSIIFKKNFYCGYRKGNKLQELLDRFDLGSQYLPEIKDTKEEFLRPMNIRWELVEKKMKQYQKQSTDFILSSLKKMKSPKTEMKNYTAYQEQIDYRVYYHSGLKKNDVRMNETNVPEGYDVKLLDSGALECQIEIKNGVNDGKTILQDTPFLSKEHKFIGYYIRFKIDTKDFWYLEDGSFAVKDDYMEECGNKRKLFSPGDAIPFLPVMNIKSVVVVAAWKLKYKEIVREKAKHIIHKMVHFLKS